MHWISSKKPNKQRKYRFNAPLHIKGKFLNVHLSKELRAKHKVRALRVRVGDKVKIMRGKFKKQEAKVEEVDVKKTIIYLSKIEHTKRDGSKARHPINPSNVMIVELNTDDKYRLSGPSKDKVVKEKTVESKPAKNVQTENEIGNADNGAEVKTEVKAKPVKKTVKGANNG